MKFGFYACLAILVSLTCAATTATAQTTASNWGTAQIGFFAQTGSTAQTGGGGGTSSTFNELVTNFSLHSPYVEDPRFEYGFDLRMANYPSVESSRSRVSIYQAYVGQQLGSMFGVKAGQMWLNELGALGSVGGGLVQMKGPQTENGRIRVAMFGGLEPNILEVGYASGVRKLGGFGAYDRKNGWTNVIGFVTLRDSGLTERSVLVFNNTMPIGNKLFLYQAAEYDLAGPAGQPASGLTYFFINGRYSPSSGLEFQGTYHRGRSIDTRTITQDELNGVPVDSQMLRGFLFESVEGRVTVPITRYLRVFGLYGQDKNNSTDAPNGRAGAGFYASNIAGAWDFRVTVNRMGGGNTSYNSWYVSGGRTFKRLYASVDYSSSLSTFQLIGSDGILITSRPSTKRVGVSSVWNLNRQFSLLFNFDRTIGDSYNENRFLAGFTYRPF